MMFFDHKSRRGVDVIVALYIICNSSLRSQNDIPKNDESKRSHPKGTELLGVICRVCPSYIVLLLRTLKGMLFLGVLI